jgi:hypothetical protein
LYQISIQKYIIYIIYIIILLYYYIKIIDLKEIFVLYNLAIKTRIFPIGIFEYFYLMIYQNFF